MALSRKDMNYAVSHDPKGFVEECDAAFARKIDAAAQKIAQNRTQSRIVLLAGPSGSGKTTTAMKIQRRLEELGIRSHTISMDNYFRTMDAETAPRNRRGETDFESPFCLDMALLNRHFALLEKGETVPVPRFDFAHQRRSDELRQLLTLGKDELAIFEGIHALNDYIVGRNLQAMKLYISTRSHTVDERGGRIFSAEWLRLARRMVRDYNYRGSDAAFTWKLWAGVRRGEKLYIAPYRENADVLFDTAIPYEISILKNFVPPLLAAIPQETEGYAEIAALQEAYNDFLPLDASYLSPDALLREFIGGGNFEY